MAHPFTVRQKLAFLALALSVLCLSLGASLYLLLPSAPAPEPVSSAPPVPAPYRHNSLSDAQHLCETRAQEEFGGRLWVLVMDKLSTRLDREEGMFKVFMEAELFATEARRGPVRNYYINCFTAIHEPRVVKFQYSDDGEEFTVPGEEEIGTFGL